MRLTKLAPLLAVLTLAACQTPEVAPTIVASPQSTGYARGIDMPTNSSDVVGELQGRRWLDFVARYYRDPSSRWPPLTASEARRLAVLGVKIVTVWEWHSHDPAYFSYADRLQRRAQCLSPGERRRPAARQRDLLRRRLQCARLADRPVDQYFREVDAGLGGGGWRPAGIQDRGLRLRRGVRRDAGGRRSRTTPGSPGRLRGKATAGYNDWNIKQAAQGARFGTLSSTMTPTKHGTITRVRTRE